MDFVVGLPTSPSKRNVIWVISINEVCSFSGCVNRLTSQCAYFYYLRSRPSFQLEILKAIARIVGYEVEFEHNFFQSSSQITPYEALYGRWCRMLLC
ncbi:reverse transcriptase [Gossypium australe]|uniref:Reverse transcriptase n=1 Tax=Gossypium australe TaxID=47621 RepID=A0A5B6VD75_9ROSI|nr:reverse transcriptase [Gossypium australe]